MSKSDTPKKSTPSTSAAPPILTEERQLLIRKQPAFNAKEIQRMLKPAEGFERVVPNVLGRLAGHPELAKLARADLPVLTTLTREAAEFAADEVILAALTQRVKGTRLDHESDVYRVLLRVNRMIQESEDTALQTDFADLAEWVAASHEGDPEPPPKKD